jgi:Tfp pilus assembly protein PilF
VATISEAEAIGWAYLEAGDYARAERVYRQILDVDASSSRVWFLLGAISQLRGALDEAILCYREALRHNPGHAEAWSNLGLALHDREGSAEAETCCREALRLNPEYADAHSNLGNILQARDDLEGATSHYREALRLNPGHAKACHNLGNALRSLGRRTEALACYDRALALDPEHAEMHLSRALLRLEMGDFVQGWSEYEWRWRCPEFSLPPYPQPLWNGSPLSGRTILLHADHGLGDTLQFIRYAPLVSHLGGRVLVACQKPLARLLSTCPAVVEVIAEGEPLPAFDVYAPLMSLPRILGTTLATVPANIPYLSADPGLVAHWGRALAPLSGFKVGIVWQGNPGYRRDRERSFPLAQLAPLSRIPGVQLISLQRGPGREQLGALTAPFVLDLGDRLGDFHDDAAVLQNLDLVIAADTSLAHLAGALGVPTWLALPLAPDSRWLVGRDDSPWYPNHRLFRQRRRGDWDHVFDRIAEALRTSLNVD